MLDLDGPQRTIVQKLEEKKMSQAAPSENVSICNNCVLFFIFNLN